MPPANVYWTDYIYNAVRQCAIGGCNNNPTTLASNQSQPWAIAVDGTNVYWTTTGVDGGVFSQITARAIVKRAACLIVDDSRDANDHGIIDMPCGSWC